MNEAYIKYVKSKSTLRYLAGLLIRLKSYIKYYNRIQKARKKGATIGEGVTITSNVVGMANKNLTIGDHSSINNSYLDTRNPLTIGNNVIIGGGNTILTTSHDVDSTGYDVKNYGLVIEDYVWIAMNATILPSCRKIGYGAVIGAGSVVVKDVEPMAIMSGNPAKELRKRKEVHSDLVVEHLIGGDYLEYKKARKA